jgi:type I restriction enzyme S subunit
MPSFTIIPEYSQFRKYDQLKSVVFCKTHEPFGGLSNMAADFTLWVNGIPIRTSEALYQACRFPHLPEVQRMIIEQASPMSAKMKSKPHRGDSRLDWEQARVDIMRWCLHVKLAQNWEKFSTLLLKTGEHPIVEMSRKDPFWGAKKTDDQTLVGMNVLGNLLMELREAIRNNDRIFFLRVEPLDIPDFLLMGQPIGPIIAEEMREGKKAEQISVQEKPLIDNVRLRPEHERFVKEYLFRTDPHAQRAAREDRLKKL